MTATTAAMENCILIFGLGFVGGGDVDRVLGIIKYVLETSVS